MKLKELKTCFWGYQKAGVFQYITDLEEQFSARLLEKDQQIQELTRGYQEQIAALEEQVKRLQEGRTETEDGPMAPSPGELLEAKEYDQEQKQEAEPPAQQVTRSPAAVQGAGQDRNMSLFQRRKKTVTDQEEDKGGT